jgi:hypothetical protein
MRRILSCRVALHLPSGTEEREGRSRWYPRSSGRGDRKIERMSAEEAVVSAWLSACGRWLL